MIKPIKKPLSIAESSARALTRHQNHLRTRTAPGPVPIAITSLNIEPILLLNKAVSTPIKSNKILASWPMKIVSLGPADGLTNLLYRS